MIDNNCSLDQCSKSIDQCGKGFADSDSSGCKMFR